MINQAAFMAVAEILPDRVAALENRLKAIGDVVDMPGCPIEFKKMLRIHFMRWLVLHETKDLNGQPIPPYLVLCTNFDEPLGEHLRELAEVGGTEVRAIYNCCKGFGQDTDVCDFLRRHAVRYSAFYVGTRGRTVEQVRAENDLRNAIQGFLDQSGFSASQGPLAIRQAIQEFVRRTPGLNWALQTPSALEWYWFFWGSPIVVACLLVAACILAPWLLGAPWWLVPTMIVGAAVALVLAALVWRQAVIRHENREARAPLHAAAVGAPVADLTDREDQVVQNQLSNVVLVTPGWFRRCTLKIVLSLVNLLGRYWYVRGALGGIPTIHFARWVIIDKGRRLLFLSNFDGSWENYLGDFIDKAAAGLTAIWSNAVGCPPAHGLIEGGARDESRFKAWTRENQLFTQVWYSAYDDLSVENINNNSYIRLGLSGHMSAGAAQKWLARL